MDLTERPNFVLEVFPLETTRLTVEGKLKACLTLIELQFPKSTFPDREKPKWGNSALLSTSGF